jgi:hypothetical protein
MRRIIGAMSAMFALSMPPLVLVTAFVIVASTAMALMSCAVAVVAGMRAVVALMTVAAPMRVAVRPMTALATMSGAVGPSSGHYTWARNYEESHADNRSDRCSEGCFHCETPYKRIESEP